MDLNVCGCVVTDLNVCGCVVINLNAFCVCCDCMWMCCE